MELCAHRKIKCYFKNLVVQKPYYLNNTKKCVNQPYYLIIYRFNLSEYFLDFCAINKVIRLHGNYMSCTKVISESRFFHQTLMRRFILTLTFTLFASLAFSQMEDFAGRRKINGTNLYFSVKGKGDYLLVIHGGPGLNHSYFKPYLNPLENTFKVVYYDQRACGKSSTPASDSISLKFLVDDIEGIRKVLKTEKINILAHSWGVVLAIQYGLQYPGRISKLILSDPVMLSREYDQEAAALVQKKSTKEDSVVRAKIVSDGNLDTKDYEELFRLSFNPSAYNRDNVAKINLNLPDNFGVANNALFTGLMKDPSMNANLYDSLPSLKFPVLVIHGQADVVPLSAVKRLKENLPKAQLEVFERSGHFPFVEESVLYNEKVKTFFKND